MMLNQEKWLIIVNPNAGAGKGEKNWPAIEKILVREGFNFHAEFTGSMGDAVRIARQGIEAGIRNIAVVGGDGTLNEAANGILAQNVIPSSDITLALIPVGTGNDWGRMYEIPHDAGASIALLRNGKRFLQDVCRVSYRDDENTKSRFFINLAGIGFDAEVVRRTNASKQAGHGGHLLYLFQLLMALFSYKSLPIRIVLDDTERVASFFAISIGICKYKGGGMITAPHAIPDDGLIDITLIHHIGRLEVLRSLPLLFNGRIHTHKKVETFRASKVILTSDRQAHLETDGELLGTTPLEFTIMPRTLRVVTGLK